MAINMTNEDLAKGKRQDVIVKAVYGAVFVGLALWGYSCSRPRTRAVLLEGGKAEFLRIGFASKETYQLGCRERKWAFDGGELSVPYECKYNDTRNLLLEDGCKAYMVDHAKNQRWELKVVKGEWSYDVGDHWESIFDLDYIDPN